MGVGRTMANGLLCLQSRASTVHSMAAALTETSMAKVNVA